MSILTKEQILQADDLKTVDVDVPEWGGTVRVRALTGAERDELQTLFINPDGTKKDVPTIMNTMKHAAMVKSIIGEDGARLFTDADVSALIAKSSAPLDRVWNAIESLSAVAGGESEKIKGN